MELIYIFGICQVLFGISVPVLRVDASNGGKSHVVLTKNPNEIQCSWISGKVKLGSLTVNQTVIPIGFCTAHNCYFETKKMEEEYELFSANLTLTFGMILQIKNNGDLKTSYIFEVIEENGFSHEIVITMNDLADGDSGCTDPEIQCDTDGAVCSPSNKCVCPDVKYSKNDLADGDRGCTDPEIQCDTDGAVCSPSNKCVCPDCKKGTDCTNASSSPSVAVIIIAILHAIVVIGVGLVIFAITTKAGSPLLRLLRPLLVWLQDEINKGLDRIDTPAHYGQNDEENGQIRHAAFSIYTPYHNGQNDEGNGHVAVPHVPVLINTHTHNEQNEAGNGQVAVPHVPVLINTHTHNGQNEAGNGHVAVPHVPVPINTHTHNGQNEAGNGHVAVLHVPVPINTPTHNGQNEAEKDLIFDNVKAQCQETQTALQETQTAHKQKTSISAETADVLSEKPMDGAGAGESSVSRTPMQVVDDAETTAVLSEKPMDGADAGAGGSSVPQISIEAVNDENRVDDDNKDPESELLLSADNNTEVLVDTSKEPKEEDHLLPRKGRDNDDDDDDAERNYHSIKRGVKSQPELNVLGKPVRKTDW